MKCLQLLAGFLLLALQGTNGALHELFRWKQIGYRDFTSVSTVDGFIFQDRMERVTTPTNQTYIPYNNVPMGVTHYKGRLFITMPRRRPGIPATLNYINLESKTNGASPLLRGYPDYETNALEPTNSPNPEHIVSVYRTRVDDCDRLWFVDTGVLEYPNNRIQVQRPSIWIVNLATNQRVHRFEIPEAVVAMGQGMASITVDVESGQCDKAFAYVPDLGSNRMYVYSLEADRMWAFSHNYFHMDPVHGDFDVGGVQYQWDDGIFSITLGPKNARGFRTAYFHPMVGINEFTVSTEVLRNETNAQRSYHGRDFELLGPRQVGGQSAMHDLDETTGIMFYAEVGRNAIGCWNTRRPFSAKNHHVVHRDDQRMIYPGDMNVDRDGTLWVMSNTMPRFIYASLDENEFNFRVWRMRTVDAVRGTPCE